MRKIDKFIAALLNEEHETATELFGDYVIERAQNIHEGLRRGEHPILAEDIEDDIIAEQYFTDEDLADEDTAEDGTDEAADTLSDDMGVDADADMDAEADMDADAPAEDTAEEGSTDDRLDDLESQLDELTAEFERLMAEVDGDDAPADDEVLGTDDEVETDVGGDAEVEKMEEDVAHDDDFLDLEEAIIDELEKIAVPNSDGREQGNKSIMQNGKSLPTARGTAGGPIKAKNVTHKGFDRETAPSSARLPKGINTQDHAESKLMKVSKEGDKSAELNKPVKQNNVSPVAKPKK